MIHSRVFQLKSQRRGPYLLISPHISPHLPTSQEPEASLLPFSEPSRRFLPDLGASFGIKFLRLADCRTRLWWSFSESKLMVAFRAPPDVKWDIAARVFGLELPNWLEDDVLCLGLRRVLSSSSSHTTARAWMAAGSTIRSGGVGTNA